MPVMPDTRTGNGVGALMTKIIAALLVALAIPASAIADQPVGTHKTVTCPKGKTPSKDGNCVASKSGKMGFDLAAPADDSAGSTTTQAGTRSVVTKSQPHH